MHLLLALVLQVGNTQAFVPKNRPYDVQKYALDLTVSRAGEFETTETITLVPAAALASLELDAYQLTVTAAAIDGASVPFARQDDDALRTGTLTLSPPQPLTAGKAVFVRVSFHGKAHDEQMGFFQVAPTRPGDPPYLFTHFEPDNARRFFVANDEPADKATSELTVRVEPGLEVISNGRKVEDAVVTEPSASGPRTWHRVRWVQDLPHSPYLVALAIGRFDHVPVKAKVPATIHVPPGTAPLAAEAQAYTAKALAAEADFVRTPYPWAKFDQVAVPRFFWGGMENTSLVMARASRLLLDEPGAIAERNNIHGLIAHEMAHQWFGDLVTCQWWDDTWLNEGFATYLTWTIEQELGRDERIPVHVAYTLMTDYFRQEDGPKAHALVGRGAPSPEDVFDSTSYTKGAAVLRMLEHRLGRERFRDGLKAYLQTYRYKAASSDELFSALGAGAKVTGAEAESLTHFRDAWLRQVGYPVVTARGSWDGKRETLAIEQRPNHAEVKALWDFDLTVVAHRASKPAYAKKQVVRVNAATQQVQWELPAEPEWIDLNEGHLALARIAPESQTEVQWIAAARADPDPAWRLVALFNLIAPMMSPAHPVEPTPAAVDAIGFALGHDPSAYLRARLMQRLLGSPLPRLPSRWEGPVLEVATHGAKAKDPVTRVIAQGQALSLLGRFGSPASRAALVKGLADPKVSIDLLGHYAEGLAGVGDAEAIAALEKALEAQAPRGERRFYVVGVAYGNIQSPQAFAALRRLFGLAPGNNELGKSLFYNLRENPFRTSPEAAAFVRDFVLEDKSFGDDMRSLMLGVLDDSKTEPARSALTAVAERADSERIRARARQVLEKNFPGSH